MKKVYLIGAVLAVVALLIAGCAKSKQTYVAPGSKGTFTVEKSGRSQETTIVTKEGKATVTGGENLRVTEAQLGVPKYPGSEMQISGKFEGAQKEAGKTTEQYVMFTKDSVEKVYGFYKSKVKNMENSMLHDMGQGQMGMFTVNAGKQQISVNIASDTKNKRTMIMVVKTQGQ